MISFEELCSIVGIVALGVAISNVLVNRDRIETLKRRIDKLRNDVKALEEEDVDSDTHNKDAKDTK
jgi:hypothetical protein